MDNNIILQKVKELFDQQLGSRIISKQLGITRWAVQKAYKELGIYNIGRQKPRKVHLLTEKKCKICKQIKPIDQFRKRIKKNNLINFETYCLDCEKEYNKKSCKERLSRRL